MSNMWGRSGAPMIQPTKDELRQWLHEAREEADTERGRRVQAEHELKLARRKLGRLVLEGKIAIPAEQLGEIVLRMAEADEIEAEDRERRLLAQD
ncbi:hypothetical protein JQ612_07830 [Bradyrhizobium manausense]|uniref:hypothetical protein n=1 Tax=Bradyrhizobium manausense TaxID=989370 RepID=UPI001BADC7F2|nr:hypothetical protein [Bradyrhizobium manausense]MBR0722059.1 hypothetical protein [Bradyrhizobium manausense]MBR0833099.1 hypothetical protein [Bradyrhizobium manausense]